MPISRSLTGVFALALSLISISAAAQTPLPYLSDPNFQSCLTDQISKNGWQFAEQVTVLSCPGRGITRLDGITGLPKLQDLDLSDNQITSLYPLASLSKVTRLNLGGNRGIRASDLLPVLSNIGPLTSLNLNGINIGNASVLNNLINPRTNQPFALTELDLGYTNLTDNYGSRNLDLLRPMTTLKSLSAAGLGLSNVNALNYLPQLEQLDLSYNDLGTNGYFNLVNLKRLNLAGNRLMPLDMLAAMINPNSNLTSLNLNGIPIPDFRKLGALVDFRTGKPFNLTELDLGNTHVKDANGQTTLSFLQAFPNLTKLYLANNGISDAQALSRMTQLTELDLSGGQLSSVTALNTLHGLTRLNLAGNRGLSFGDVLANLLVPNPNLTSIGLNGIFIGPGMPLLSNPQTGRPYALTELDLGNTLIDPQGLSQIGNYASLARLNLSGNGLPGYSPWYVLRTLYQMQDIDVSGNRVIDAGIFMGWNNLRRLIVSNTSLRAGDVRIVIDQNPRLAAIGVNGINLGTISSLGTLRNNQTGMPLNLTELDLGNTGILPGQSWDFLLQFPYLKRLNLANCNTGSIDYFKDMQDLADLDLSNNSMMQLPFSFQSHRITRLNLSGNKGIVSSNIAIFLSHFPSITSLSLNGIPIGPITSIGGLADMSTGRPYDLTEFDLGNTGVLAAGSAKNVNFLTSFPNLLRLNLAGNALQDTTALSTLTGVQDLDLSNNGLRDINALINYRNLTRLVLSGNPALSPAQIKPLLSQSWNLRSLGLSGITILDLNNLGPLTNPSRNMPYDLRDLDLSNSRFSNTMPSAGPVFMRFRNLQTLNLAGNGLLDINGIGGAQYLVELDLSNNALADISQIPPAHTLRRLNLSGNSKLTSSAINMVLYNNPDLYSIGLNGINLLSLNNIGNLNKQGSAQAFDLLELDLGNTGLKDIDGLYFLNRFPFLQRLNVAGNGLRSISGLNSTFRLRDLDLSNNLFSYAGDLFNLRTNPTLGTLNLTGDSAITCVDLNNLVLALPRTQITRPTICMVTNIPPVANAGANQSVINGTTVSLNGSGTDSDGTIASYAWRQLSGPAVTLSSAAAPATSFVSPTVTADTVFSFQLTVTDNKGATATSTTNVTVKPTPNQPPVVSAGPDQTSLGDRVTLSGAATDTDGTIASYAWVQTAGPAVSLSGANTATAQFWPQIPFTDTVFSFKLTATDNRGATSSATTNVTVKGNIPPLATVGPNQTVYPGDRVQLTGSGSDSDGTIISYWWTQSAGPTVALSNSNTAVAQFVAPQVTSDTVLVFQFMVTDNRNVGMTTASSITVKANALPVVNAGTNQTVIGGNSVTLSGSASDSDGTIASYSWVQTGGPAVTLLTPNAASTSFASAAVAANTTLSFMLTATDDHGGSASSNVTVTLIPVPNLAPVANAGQDQTVQNGSTVTLYGNGLDPDGYVASYNWVQIAGPAVTLTSPNAANTSFTAPTLPADTVLTFQLTVTDNQGATGVATVNVTATELPDLAFDSIDGWAAYTGVQYPFNVNATIRNIGKKAVSADNVLVTFYLSTDQYRLSSDAIEIGSSFVSLNLDAGQATTISLSAMMPMDTPFHPFYVYAVVNGNKRFKEANENNNQLYGGVINPI